MRARYTICALLWPEVALAQCKVPEYHLGLTTLDTESKLVRNISIPIADFGPSGLACLANSLNRIYRNRGAL